MDLLSLPSFREAKSNSRLCGSERNAKNRRSVERRPEKQYSDLSRRRGPRERFFSSMLLCNVYAFPRGSCHRDTQCPPSDLSTVFGYTPPDRRDLPLRSQSPWLRAPSILRRAPASGSRVPPDRAIKEQGPCCRASPT